MESSSNYRRKKKVARKQLPVASSRTGFINAFTKLGARPSGAKARIFGDPERHG
jgi:hypothetical protein